MLYELFRDCMAKMHLFCTLDTVLPRAVRLKRVFNLQQTRGKPCYSNPFLPKMHFIRVVHRGADFSLKLVDFSSGFQQLDLCSALKETLSVFSVSANWPAGRAAGLQQPAAAAVNIKYSQSASITGSLHLLFNTNTFMGIKKNMRWRLRNNSHRSGWSETLYSFKISRIKTILISNHYEL